MEHHVDRCTGGNTQNDAPIPKSAPSPPPPKVVELTSPMSCRQRKHSNIRCVKMLLFGVDGTLPLTPFTPWSDVKRGRVVLVILSIPALYQLPLSHLFWDSPSLIWPIMCLVGHLNLTQLQFNGNLNVHSSCYKWHFTQQIITSIDCLSSKGHPKNMSHAHKTPPVTAAISCSQPHVHTLTAAASTPVHHHRPAVLVVSACHHTYWTTKSLEHRFFTVWR